MPRPLQATLFVLVISCFLLAVFASNSGTASELPLFGRDTVLVWNISNQDESATFVVRIAQFLPDRYIEWENATTQGTIFMPQKAVFSAKTFVNARLFEGGVDTKGRDATTLWLSQQVYRDLKSKTRVKLSIDSVQGWMTVEGNDQLVVDINRSPKPLPVLKVKDDRGQERWFLDKEENALLVKHVFRAFSQTLKSITTDRPNTLRWIKGKKLNSPRQ